jgi:hypothetical protein
MAAPYPVIARRAASWLSLTPPTTVGSPPERDRLTSDLAFLRRVAGEAEECTAACAAFGDRTGAWEWRAIAAQARRMATDLRRDG